MEFTVIIKDKKEKKESSKNLIVKDVLNDYRFSSETAVVKKNGEIVLDEVEVQVQDDKYQFNSPPLKKIPED